MNLWQCDEPGCKNSVVGLGGAIGLRAVGWYFREGSGMRGPRIFCPRHRPDPLPSCEDEMTPLEDQGKPCPICAALREARRWQRLMGYDGELGLMITPADEREDA